MDTINYHPKKLLKCTDMYSWDWIVDQLQITLIHYNDNMYVEYITRNGVWRETIVCMFDTISYKTQLIHPQIYLDLLGKREGVHCQIDLS